MKISVIVPVYNCEPYVERCVRSIMVQSYTDLQIICIDDGSVDGSGALLDKLALEDVRIQVIHQKNAGAAAARNAGLDVASGELITFVDSDDAIEPDMYETLIPYFADENVDIVHCGYKRIRLDGSVKDVNGTGKIIRQTKYEAAECLISGRLFVGSLWNKLFRAQLIKPFRMDPQLVINEDVLLLAKVFAQSITSVYLDIGKYQFIERGTSTTSVTTQHKKLNDCLVVAERMFNLYKGTPAQASAEKRVLNTQIGLYRWYVMNDLSSSRRVRTGLIHKIDPILKKRNDVPLRQRINYTLMRYFPFLYRLVYSLYNNIRVPNWDVDFDG